MGSKPRIPASTAAGRLKRRLREPALPTQFRQQRFVSFRQASGADEPHPLRASGIEDAARFTRLIQGSHALAIHACMELEGDYLNLLSKIIGKSVFPVGCLPPAEEKRMIMTEEPWSKICDWLDKQEASSVVFCGVRERVQIVERGNP
ncbi:hypothetical protein SASPL_111405 [Salvia splendens]|uniref:Uncharacterized protein n=1 Tax=Salvia splendens TaxID=180675 RepID=A0A8X8Y806_SALSN|nr:hypothetical protein SASPL_111405 [Salvia splendens]